MRALWVRVTTVVVIAVGVILVAGVQVASAGLGAAARKHTVKIPLPVKANEALVRLRVQVTGRHRGRHRGKHRFVLSIPKDAPHGALLTGDFIPVALNSYDVYVTLTNVQTPSTPPAPGVVAALPFTIGIENPDEKFKISDLQVKQNAIRTGSGSAGELCPTKAEKRRLRRAAKGFVLTRDPNLRVPGRTTPWVVWYEAGCGDSKALKDANTALAAAGDGILKDVAPQMTAGTFTLSPFPGGLNEGVGMLKTTQAFNGIQVFATGSNQWSDCFAQNGDCHVVNPGTPDNSIVFLYHGPMTDSGPFDMKSTNTQYSNWGNVSWEISTDGGTTWSSPQISHP